MVAVDQRFRLVAFTVLVLFSRRFVQNTLLLTMRIDTLEHVQASWTDSAKSRCKDYKDCSVHKETAQ